MLLLGLFIIWLFILSAEKFMALSYFGWALLALIGFLNIELILYSAFFFAAFFHPSGVFENSFFTPKHFQIIGIIGLFHTLRLALKKPTAPNLRSLTSLSPFLLLFLLSLFSSWRTGQFNASLTYHLNLLLTWGCLLLLASAVTERKRKLSSYALFFAGGMAVQILVCFINLVFHTHIFSLHIIHNNHIGIQSAFCVFYPLTFLALGQGKSQFMKGILFLLLGILFLGLVFACCRNAYICFFVVYLIFFTLLKHAPDPHVQKTSRRFALILPLGLIPLVLLSMLVNFDVLARFASLFLEVLNVDSWFYSLSDHENFGFLGLFRLVQFYDLYDILQTHPLLGMGMTHRALEFHGLYLTILASTGLIGFSIFVLFVRHLLHQSLESLRVSPSTEIFSLRLSSYVATLLWLLCGFLETFFLQFSPWINLLLLTIAADFFSKNAELTHKKAPYHGFLT